LTFWIVALFITGVIASLQALGGASSHVLCAHCLQNRNGFLFYMPMIRRAVSNLIHQRLAQFPAVALIGPRQCGKTTLARSLSRRYDDLEQPSERLRLDIEWYDSISSLIAAPWAIQRPTLPLGIRWSTFSTSTWNSSVWLKLACLFGDWIFNHLDQGLAFGYKQMEVASRQFAFVASPEKALLDLIHLTPGGDSPEYLHELRLQNPEVFDVSSMLNLARRSGKPKWIRAAKTVGPLLEAEAGEPIWKST
jgi:hypothetical protein